MKPIADQNRPNITIKDRDNRDVNYDTTLQIQVDESTYQAVWKDFRSVPNLPSENANGQKITWFNGFGAKYKDGKNLEESRKVDFTVTVRRPPNAPNGTTRKLCFYDSKLPGTDYKSKVLDLKEEPESTNEFIVFKLSIGDPPTGMYP